MSGTIGWTGGSDDDAWERAEDADYRADRRRKAGDRAALMDASVDWPVNAVDPYPVSDRSRAAFAARQAAVAAWRAKAERDGAA